MEPLTQTQAPATTSAIAEVAVDIPHLGSRTFHYTITQDLARHVVIGSAVLVTFRNRPAVGYVVGFADVPQVRRVLPIQSLLDSPPLPPDLLELAGWLARRYIAPLNECIRLILPPGGQNRLERRIAVAAKPGHAGLDASGLLREAVNELVEAGGELTERQLSGGADTAAQLLSRGLATTVYRLAEPSAKARKLTFARLGDRLGEVEGAPAQRRILEVLARCGEIDVPELLRRAPASRGSLQALVAKGLVLLEEKTVTRARSVAALETEALPELTDEQRTAVDAIGRALRRGNSSAFLLNGVTGSGKTEVYMRAIAQALGLGRNAIVLVPEIALTPQTCKRFQERFGEHVAILHSGLGVGQRYDEWHHIARGERRVVVGTRSALFAPLPDVGLIVVDEEQENSYKQDRSPRYHARDVARKRAQIGNGVVVYGSATPSLDIQHRSETRGFQVLNLSRRIGGRPMPRVTLVDLRREARRTLISDPLREAVSQSLDAGQKAMLLLNRRGFANFLLCSDCGNVPQCPHCSITLTYHRSRSLLRCHHCGHWSPAPVACPNCEGTRLLFKGAGTQRAGEELEALFPGVPIIRMDADTTTGKGSHASHLNRFNRSERAVLLGTQMIAKGLDFPEVSTVGLLNADSALYLPDFRAAERTFQLLVQMSGRAGRGEVPGRVFVQTYNPDHYALASFSSGDTEGFYEAELAFRRELAYPPYGRLINVVISAPEAPAASEAAAAVARRLAAVKADGVTELLGPAPAPIYQLKGRFRWHVLVKFRHGEALGRLGATLAALRLPHPHATMAIDVDPVTVL